MTTAVQMDEAVIPLNPDSNSTTNNEPLDGELDGDLNKLASSATLTLKNFSLKQLYQSQWQNMRSWGSFIDTNKMKLPTATMQWSNRFIKNIEYFRSNYLCVFVILMIYCILTSPFLLLAIAASVGICYLITLKNKEQPIKILNYPISLTHQYIGVAICSFPFFYFVGASSALFWVIGASFFIIGLHSSIYAIEELEKNNEQPDLFQTFPPLGSIENV